MDYFHVGSSEALDFVDTIQQKLSHLRIVSNLISKSNGLCEDEASSVGDLLSQLVDEIRSEVDESWQEWRRRLYVRLIEGGLS